MWIPPRTALKRWKRWSRDVYKRQTLLDVLDYMEKVPMVTAYKLTDGTTTTRFPMGEDVYKRQI